MTSAVTPLALVKRRLKALKTPLPAALEGDAAALHRARVASRRLRELLPLVMAGKGISSGTRKRVRQLTRWLGRVREMDVALELLQNSHEGVPRSAVFHARQHLHAGRESQRAHMLEKINLKKIERSLDELVQVAAEQGDVDWQRTLATRLTRRAARLKEAVGEAGAIYVPERLHAVRLASKKLRYALELAAEAGVRDAAKLAVVVRRTQVTLGALQDRHVLVREVNDAAARIVDHDEAASIPRHGLLTLAARLEQAGRELHGQFLSQRDDLLAAAVAVPQRIVPELLRGRRAQARAALTSRRAGIPRARRVS